MKTQLINLLGIVLAFLSPIQGLLILMILMVLLDTSVAVYSTIKLNGIKSFTSYKLFNIVPKLTFYLLSIIIGYFIDIYVLQGYLNISLPISKLVTVLYCYVEIKSLDEHIQSIGGRSMWVVFKEMINRLSNIKKNLKSINEA